MSFRYLFIVSLNLKSVLYLRRFPNVERKAQTLSLAEVRIAPDLQLVSSLLTSLAINPNESQSEFECFLANQLPVIELTYNKTKLWPILVVEQNGLLFCCLPLCENQSNQLIDQKSIALCFTALQTISRCFTLEKGSLAWIEWFITSMAPFGTLINQKYESLHKMYRKIRKTENALQSDSLKLIVIELISRTKDKEVVFGTISTDESYCAPNLIENGLLSLRIGNMDSMNLVLPNNCCTNGPNLQIRLQSNPFDIIHYKCSSDTVPVKTFLSYSYNISHNVNQKNLYKINLTLNLKNSTQFKFNYFNVQFRQMTETNQTMSTIKSSLTFGQLRYQTDGLFWVIGTKFPKSGQIKLNFETICFTNKVLELETNCNFKIENFQTSLSYADSQHLSVDDLSFVANTKMPVIIDSTLTSIDYKLFPEIN